MASCEFCVGAGGVEKELGDDVVWFICPQCSGSGSVDEIESSEPLPEGLDHPWLLSLLPLALESVKKRMGAGPQAFEGVDIVEGYTENIKRLFYTETIGGESLRIVLHRMPANKVVASHNHNCQSAVLVVKGRYIHAVGTGPDDELVSSLHGPGTSWFIGDERAWHSITTLEDPVYTLMLQSLRLYDDHEASQNIGAGTPMSEEEKGMVWSDYGRVGLELK